MLATSGRVARKTRKGRTATVRPSTKLLASNDRADNTPSLRLQRLSQLGVFGSTAAVLAVLAWGEPV